MSWRLTKGVIPDGLFVLHRCDNPPCVNPDHLFLGTGEDNIQDRNRKGRTAIGNDVACAKLTPETVAMIVSEYGAGGETHRSLAARYGVDHTTIGDMLRGQTWRAARKSMEGRS